MVNEFTLQWANAVFFFTFPLLRGERRKRLYSVYRLNEQCLPFANNILSRITLERWTIGDLIQFYLLDNNNNKQINSIEFRLIWQL